MQSTPVGPWGVGASAGPVAADLRRAIADSRGTRSKPPITAVPLTGLWGERGKGVGKRG